MCGSRIAVIPLVFTIEESADIRPNIMGTFYQDVNAKIDGYTTGAFSYTGGSRSNLATSPNHSSGYVEMDASKASELYSKQTIQPISGYSLMIIKE